MNKEKYQEARRMLCQYLYKLAKEKGITHDMIAERTGFDRSNISRMLAAKYSPTLDNFIKLAEAVDAYFFVIDREANDDLVQTMKDRWGETFNN